MNAGKALLSEQDQQGVKVGARIQNLEKLWFIADAPLFMDNTLVARLYDAIFRPEFEVASRTEGGAGTRSAELAGEIGASKEASIPTFVKLSAAAKLGGKLGATASTSQSVTETAVRSGERKQEELLNLYAYSYPERLFFVDPSLETLHDLNGKLFTWDQADAVLDIPGVRPLVVFELGKGANIIPMFGELTSGEDVDLYKRFLEAIPHDSARRVPTYPSRKLQDYAARAKEYWTEFFNVFDSQIAMQVIEKATRDGGRFDWLDYRLIAIKDDETPIPLHLHVVGRGEYPSGTFAYQLVRRGANYGVRIVGTLKKGGDINVLSLYER